MKTPTISIVMPAYNISGYISESIKSVLNQTFCDFELIVVDDGSTDNTKDVVKAIADKAPLKVIFRDSCFAQDDAKINIYESFKQLLNWSDDEVFKNIKVI